MADTVKARLQQPDGNYLRASKVLKDAPLFSSQEFLMKLAEGKVELDAIPGPLAGKTIKKLSKEKAEAAD
jgi:polyphosphate kinase